METTSNRSPLFGLFFWLFNLTLLLIAYVGLLPFIGTGLIADALKGELPFDFLLFLIGLVGVPTTVTIISLNNSATSDKRSIPLTKLFYGVEVPMLAVCMLRFFWLRELTPSSILILTTGFICVGAYLHQLIYNKPTGKGAWIQLVCHSLMLAIALYVGLLALFYVLPISAAILYGISHTPIETTFMVLFYAIVLFPVPVILTAIATGPFGITSVYFQAWRQNLHDFGWRYGKNKAWGVTISVLLVWLFLLVVAQKQPQTEVFELLQKPNKTASDRALLVQQSEKIRQGLLNAYLAPYRYQDYGQENTNIRDLYRTVFHWEESAAQTLQDTYNILASPFLYNGRRTDRDTAAKLYAEFFDTPILRGEQKAIQKAVQSTFNRTEAKAGLLDVDEKKVWLAEQQIKVEPQGDWANVEVYEIYKNQTFEDQEIFYSFSLPQSAVITGVWLGNDSNRSNRFPFIVSTRGAAQQVYNAQVQRRVDPALLEQIGPNNYRLRAFPIPAGEGRELHLWMTYQTLQTKDGIALPQLSEKRNIYWTKDTKRLSNGKAIKSTQDSWFPIAIAANPIQPLQHQTNLNGYQITAKPLTSQDYHLPQNKHIAVVLDTSYSMAAHRKEANETFKQLKALSASNDFDLYQTSAPGIAATKVDDITKFDVEKVTFYGTMQPLYMLQQFEKLRGNTAYDAILLISDRGSYELGDDKAKPVALSAPLWIVHLGGVQSAYDDAIFETIQASGGGVATKVENALARFTTQSELKPAVISVDDGYAWFSQKTDVPADPKDEFNPFAARQLVNYLSQDRDLQKIANLDGIHKVAKAAQIVTPYSSMIVLVNDQQKKDLKAAEQKKDRFKREIEDKQPAPQMGNPLDVSAVPEPAEWMLILVVAIALGLIVKRKQTNADARG
ncbi:TIGR02921 family PEP-CTERM protein [Aliterella atlantica]|uniref:VIT domain-containing protein n=1 Tax=Aliterella atlantica CENA595 TaxID=1618023 RepID=A0A0D8ZRE4_9CYAN|nr:TIGR02921 family PEP-CTERM protein [Aliterella atlantica]KJH71290.1 hypothetical protein UH38_13470 [Aliterella atlantica CENA595]